MERPDQDHQSEPFPTSGTPHREDVGYGDDGEERPRRSFGIQPLVWGALLVGLAGVLVVQYVVPFMAELHATRADQLVREGKYEEALEHFDKALSWQPEQPGMYLKRGEIHIRGGNPEAALEDFNHFIEINPHHAPAFEKRSTAHLMLGNGEEAISDAREAKALWGEPNRAHALNMLAYMQALANQQLPEALQNVDEALSLIDENRQPAHEAAYRDTRAYILHLLDRNEEALPDAEKALRLAREQREELENEANRQGISGDRLQAFLDRADETIAVLLHHRGLIHEQLGNQEQAQEDQTKAEEFGFDPSKGVF